MLRFTKLDPVVLAKRVAQSNVTLSIGAKKCGEVTESGGRFSVSAGKSPSPADFKKSIYTAIGRANQIKKESGVTDMTLSIEVPSISPKKDQTTSGLFFKPVPPRKLYSCNTDKSIVIERAVTYTSLSQYKFCRFKNKSEVPARILLQSSMKVDPKAVKVGNIIANCVSDARNLGNLRHDEGNPSSIGDWILGNIAGNNGIRLRHSVVGNELLEGGLTMLHAVGKGSVHQPRMIVLEYIGDPRATTAVGLVGKGVTFDCGGLNVKPFGSMETMHLDKMGAVAVVNALRGVAELKLPVNIVAAVGLVENSIGPASYHPSTILRSLSGKSVEVTNTDAEGRLVLADMLTFVQKKAKIEKKVTSVIDLATLTGAIVMALGNRRAGLFSNDSRLAKHLISAGERVDELLWPMPIGQEHRDAMKGKLSDLTNCLTKREGGACTAAGFLQAFIDNGVKWAHIDIAGPAMEETEKVAGVVGAPGFGVQLLIDYFRNL